MAKNFYTNHLSAGRQTIDLGVPVLFFVEDDTHFAYAPSLDITGYGNSLQEAKESFEIMVEEFVQYTSNKKTLEEVLTSLGWEIKSKKKGKVNYISPDLISMANSDPELKEILNHKNFQRSNHSISLPV